MGKGRGEERGDLPRIALLMCVKYVVDFIVSSVCVLMWMK